jgi:hypothetical protein
VLVALHLPKDAQVEAAEHRDRRPDRPAEEGTASEELAGPKNLS